MRNENRNRIRPPRPRPARTQRGHPGLIHAAVRLRAKHQITIPAAVAKVLQLEPGEHLVFEADVERGEVRLRRLRRSCAGSLAGLFSDAETNRRYLLTERGSWHGGDLRFTAPSTNGPLISS